MSYLFFRDGVRQSNINTKVFEVDFIENEVRFIPEDDDKEFKKDLVRNKTKVKVMFLYIYSMRLLDSLILVTAGTIEVRT